LTCFGSFNVAAIKRDNPICVRVAKEPRQV
jgi:hypothetical protein